MRIPEGQFQGVHEFPPHVGESPHVLPLDGRYATRLVAPLVVVVLVTQIPQQLQQLLFVGGIFLTLLVGGDGPFEFVAELDNLPGRSSLEELGHNR